MIPTDPRDQFWGDPPLPQWVTGFRDNQIQAVEETIEHYDRGVTKVMLDAPTGCIASDTTIAINRGGKGRSIPIVNLVHSFNGGWVEGGKGSRRQWDANIPTRSQRAEDDLVRLGEIKHAWNSGLKDTFALTTESGRTIRATAMHPFLTPDGWVELDGLSIGSEVLCNIGVQSNGRGKKTWYKMRSGLYFHPHAGRRGVANGKGGWSVPVHRLVAEARLNGMEYEQFVERVKARTSLHEMDGLAFFDPTIWAVHHRDRNHHNNDPENLEVLTHEEHHRIEALEDKHRSVAMRVDVEHVVDIRHHGIEPTHDIEMVDEPHNYIANGFVVHNTGKTLIGEMVARIVAARSLYVCTTKTLQDQFAADFPYAKVLKGRSNYPTLDHPHLFNDPFKPLTAADCTKRRVELPACSGCDLMQTTIEPVLHCENCHPWFKCPYEAAKFEAVRYRLAVVNTAYFLGESNSVGHIAKDRDLVVVDECDTLESLLMGQVEIEVTERFRNKYDIAPPQYKTKPESWQEWAETEAIPKITKARDKIQKRTTDEIKEFNRLDRMLGRIALMNREMQNPDGIGWVYDSKTWRDKEDIKFKPVRVDGVAEDFLWSHGKRWLLMSGTIIDPHEYAESLGIKDEWALVRVPNEFPKENRPVHICSIANMSYKEKDTAYPLVAKGVVKVMLAHPDERVLVHTVSYALAQFIFDAIRKMQRPELTKRLIIYSNGKEREAALDAYKQLPGAVMIAPSMDRGVDLPHDLCRVQVIAKVPFPNTSDPQVKTRMYSRGGSLWYAVQAVRTIVQMCGRGVRSRDDRCVTYIFDKQFYSNIYAKNKGLLPAWFVEAFDWSGKAMQGLNAIELESRQGPEPTFEHEPF